MSHYVLTVITSRFSPTSQALCSLQRQKQGRGVTGISQNDRLFRNTLTLLQCRVFFCLMLSVQLTLYAIDLATKQLDIFIIENTRFKVPQKHDRYKYTTMPPIVESRPRHGLLQGNCAALLLRRKLGLRFACACALYNVQSAQ